MAASNVWDKVEQRWVGAAPKNYTTYQASFQAPMASPLAFMRRDSFASEYSRRDSEYSRRSSQMSQSHGRRASSGRAAETRRSRRNSGASIASNSSDVRHLYQKAVAVGDAVPTSEDGDAYYVTKRFVRQMEVPFKRQVKVPVKTHKIVPVEVEKEVPTKRLVEVPTFVEVEEDYVDVEEYETMQEREVWVKQTVKEPVIEKREVLKKRTVKVPTTELREVEEMERVKVTENQVVEVDAYRVDEVEDTQLVEVEEYQKYRLEPTPVGDVATGRVRPQGRTSGGHLARRIGPVYDRADSFLRDVDDDSQPDDRPRSHYTRRDSETSRTSRGSQRSRGSRPSRATPPRRVVVDDDVASQVSYVSWD